MLFATSHDSDNFKISFSLFDSPRLISPDPTLLNLILPDLVRPCPTISHLTWPNLGLAMLCPSTPGQPCNGHKAVSGVAACKVGGLQLFSTLLDTPHHTRLLMASFHWFCGVVCIFAWFKSCIGTSFSHPLHHHEALSFIHHQNKTQDRLDSFQTSPILAEFKVPIGFCLQPPRLDSYSFS
jgi:hypothetical protein